MTDERNVSREETERLRERALDEGIAKELDDGTLVSIPQPPNRKQVEGWRRNGLPPLGARDDDELPPLGARD